MLLGIESRGRDATGFAFRDPTGQFQVHKRDMTASEFATKKRLCIPRDARMAIMHTRWSTQGSPTNNYNNHPILTGDVVGVHNGHVNNDMEIFRELKTELGFSPRIGWVDSEAIFAPLGWLPDLEVKKALELVEGSAAVAWMDLQDEDEVLHLARIYSSPLVLAFTEGGSLIFASEQEAIVDACKATGMVPTRIYELDEGQYLQVKDGEVIDVQSFDTNPGCYYSYSSRYSRNYSTPSWDEMEYMGMAPTATVTGIIDDDEAERYQQWLQENAECIDRILAENDEELSGTASRSQALLLQDSPYLNAAYLSDVSLGIAVMETDLFGELYSDRLEAIKEWFGKCHASTETLTGMARDMKAFARPGQTVKTKFSGRDVYGHIYKLPKTFPDGDFILRLYISATDARDGVEAVFVARKQYDFDLVQAAGADGSCEQLSLSGSPTMVNSKKAEVVKLRA